MVVCPERKSIFRVPKHHCRLVPQQNVSQFMHESLFWRAAECAGLYTIK